MSEPATILIIEDTRGTREALVRIVEELGYRTVVAESGAEGVRQAHAAHPSLVLLDVEMPGLDGFKVAAAIKQLPRFVPVVLLTAKDDLDSRRRGQAAGADDFLGKPVQPLELSIRIAAMLRIKSLTDALDAANQRLAELADTDMLTGLPNRRRFEAWLQLEHERAQRYKRPLAFLMIDVDHFKRVNDTRGHLVGDEVLKSVADRVAGTLRKSDRVGRLGGEEFGVLSPEASAGGALALGERLRGRVEATPVGEQPSQLQVTISIGVCSWDGVATVGARELWQRADDALYEAKQHGRNRVVLRQA